ncbi:hypothetical protein OU798_08425 [Prolixibacteraceae bacterium Z1-6]|uniref:Uncharacterized protein n=1 Tax=Draconibacterium aestuarii TaxID=2998507 RepID=A0A9X3F4E3_9BACT|nr:hypothetical protein [Prolixibacteraceae bacterium Z1-6]
MPVTKKSITATSFSFPVTISLFPVTYFLFPDAGESKITNGLWFVGARKPKDDGGEQKKEAGANKLYAGEHFAIAR